MPSARKIGALAATVALVSPAAYAQSQTDKVQVFGSLSFDATYTNPESGTPSTDLTVHGAELGADVMVSDQVTATASVFYAEDGDDLDLDVAKVTYLDAATGLSFMIGQDYLPFGASTSAMLSDPLTRQFGEARETLIAVNYEGGGFITGAYLFNGDQDADGENQLQNYGARLGYRGGAFGAGVDYISNIADTDLLQGKNYGLAVGADVVSAISIHGDVELGPVRLAAEHVATNGELAVDGNNSQPSLTNVEAGYTVGNSAFSVSYQMAEETLFVGLPETRISLGYGTTIFDVVDFGVELASDQDYSVADGGSGKATQTVTVRFTVPLL